MKNIVGILLVGFLTLSFFGTTTYAETKPTSEANQNEQQETPFQNMNLLKSVTDEKTGVTIDVYGGLESNPTPTPFAGNGTWDVLGGETWVMNGNINDVRTDGVYYSTGGDYSLVIPPHEMDELKSGSSPVIDIELWEEDPINDDYVASFFVDGVISYPNYYIAFRDIDRFVDGANRKAEFYTTHTTNYTVLNQALYVQYFD